MFRKNRDVCSITEVICLSKILIAGGAGFIGSHLAEALVETGHEVTIIDNLKTGNPQNIKMVMHDVEFIQADICDSIPDGNFDEVFHLASIANPREYSQNPIDVLTACSVGTLNLLKNASKTNARFYYFSSSEVYGHHEVGFYSSENCQSRVHLLQARSPYYVGKMFGEECVKSFSEANHVEYLIVRPFNIYGTRMDTKSHYGRVITNFLRWALKGLPLEINGDGAQIRSFCHIDDLLNAIGLVESLSSWERHVINIGNPEPISIKDLALLINDISGNHGGIINAVPVDNEPRYRLPDISSIENWVGWRPTISLREGILDVKEWLMKNGPNDKTISFQETV